MKGMVDSPEWTKLKKTFFVVEEPDHPFIFSGPDALIAERGKLLAFFIPSKAERSSPNKLFSRLLNARIVYPVHTQMILIRDHQKLLSYEDQLNKKFFDETIEKSDLRLAAQLLKVQKTGVRMRDLQKSQQSMFHKQIKLEANNVQYLTQPAKSTTSRGLDTSIQTKKASFYNRLLEKQETTRANIYRDTEQDILGYKKLGPKRSALNELAPFFEFSLKSEFKGVDDGGFSPGVEVKYLNLSEFPTIVSDPLKPVRIASLLGWVISLADDIDGVVKRKVNLK